MTLDCRQELALELALVNKSNIANPNFHFYSTFYKKTKLKKQKQTCCKRPALVTKELNRQVFIVRRLQVVSIKIMVLS